MRSFRVLVLFLLNFEAPDSEPQQHRREPIGSLSGDDETSVKSPSIFCECLTSELRGCLCQAGAEESWGDSRGADRRGPPPAENEMSEGRRPARLTETPMAASIPARNGQDSAAVEPMSGVQPRAVSNSA